MDFLFQFPFFSPKDLSWVDSLLSHISCKWKITKKSSEEVKCPSMLGIRVDSHSII